MNATTYTTIQVPTALYEAAVSAVRQKGSDISSLVEGFLKSLVNVQDLSDEVIKANRQRLSDDALAEALKEFAPLTDADFPELTQEQFLHGVHSMSGKMIKGVERWL